MTSSPKDLSKVDQGENVVSIADSMLKLLRFLPEFLEWDIYIYIYTSESEINTAVTSQFSFIRLNRDISLKFYAQSYTRPFTYKAMHSTKRRRRTI